MISQGYEKKQGNNDTNNLKTFTCSKMQNRYAKKTTNKQATTNKSVNQTITSRTIMGKSINYKKDENQQRKANRHGRWWREDDKTPVCLQKKSKQMKWTQVQK